MCCNETSEDKVPLLLNRAVLWGRARPKLDGEKYSTLAGKTVLIGIISGFSIFSVVLL